MTNAFLAPILILLLVAVTTGCGRYYWSRPGATAEQFAGDNRECLAQASSTVPAGAAVEATEQLYRACLNGRGYVRDKQIEPPPPDSYRGVESGEEFAAAARTGGRGSPQGFEQQLAQLDDLKARGRITEDEYATMRRRLVEGVTPGALTPPPPPPATPVAAAPTLAGRWYSRAGSILDIRQAGGQQLYWEWESPPSDRVTMRAAGTGTAAGDRISLTGRQTVGPPTYTYPAVTFTLTREGPVLRGTYQGPNNVPMNIEFTRERR